METSGRFSFGYLWEVSFLRSLALSLISGALLAFSWPGIGHPLLLFIAWVPFLYMERELGNQHKKGNKFRFFIITYAGMLVWNIGATWWVKNSTLEGGIMAFTFNTLFMSLVLLIIHLVKRRSGKILGTVFFIGFWLFFEWFHHRWDLTWPWLTLGNAFSGMPSIIQWYEYTGTPGGSLWVLLINFAILECVTTTKEHYLKFVSKGVMLVLLILLPILLSVLIRTVREDHSSDKISVVAVQPNFDPYTVKFDLSSEAQLDIFLKLATEEMHPNTRFLLLPETAISDGIYEDRFEDSYCVSELIAFAREHKGLNIIAGASTWKQFKKWETPTPTARKFGNDYYEAYNSALWIDENGVREVYHKSKLVPGVEQLPYPSLFGPLKEWAIELGGTSGTLGTQDEREVFSGNGTPVIPAPVICYESIFGDFMRGYFEEGANAIFILTNDGWWGDSPGYHQHLAFARLRAIEYRVPVIRCTNTGISCLIDPAGNVSGEIPWWTAGAAEYHIAPGHGHTFYAFIGDWISLLAMFSLLFPVLSLIRPIFARREKRDTSH